MPRTTTALLANSLESLTRALLLSLGLDHALIDFLALTAIGAATVPLAILVVAIRVTEADSTPHEEEPPTCGLICEDYMRLLAAPSARPLLLHALRRLRSHHPRTGLPQYLFSGLQFFSNGTTPHDHITVVVLKVLS